jgi:FKBP-type peptidyl-prolyl cis-trans isomerase
MEMTAANQEAAKKFLDENKGKEGVKTTASGLQYKIVKEGTGDDRPATNDTVKVHYKGTLLDGTEFDSSYKRNQPAEFQVDQVIPGWTEAMQLMNVGSTYELYLPPELAYGDRGAPPVIEPGSMLIFEVELLDVIKGEEEKKDKE